jgi:hypothetical protein
MNTPVSADSRFNENPVFSICTLVTDHEQYRQMVQSFEEHGFSGSDCEYLFLDNSEGNRYDAFSGIRRFLRSAHGRYIIICHQDILLIDDKDALLKQIDNMNQYDSSWAVLGNAGLTANHKLTIRITDPSGQDIKLGDLPARVTGLDENFLLLNADSGLSLSNGITGFHCYGIDLCISAHTLGYNAYVIDFHLHHVGGRSIAARRATLKQELGDSKSKLVKAYASRMRSRWVGNTSAQLFISGSRLLAYAMNRKITRKTLKRLHLVKF